MAAEGDPRRGASGGTDRSAATRGTPLRGGGLLGRVTAVSRPGPALGGAGWRAAGVRRSGSELSGWPGPRARLTRPPLRPAFHMTKDMLPGPYPRTPEERAAAAKKYNLRVEDYEPYPDDGTG